MALVLLALWSALQGYLEKIVWRRSPGVGLIGVTFIVNAAMTVLAGGMIILWYREHNVSDILLRFGDWPYRELSQ